MADITLNTVIDAIKKTICKGNYTEIYIKNDGDKILDFRVTKKFKYDEEIKNIYK